MSGWGGVRCYGRVILERRRETEDLYPHLFGPPTRTHTSAHPTHTHTIAHFRSLSLAFILIYLYLVLFVKPITINHTESEFSPFPRALVHSLSPSLSFPFSLSLSFSLSLLPFLSLDRALCPLSHLPLSFSPCRSMLARRSLDAVSLDRL